MAGANLLADSPVGKFLTEQQGKKAGNDDMKKGGVIYHPNENIRKGCGNASACTQYIGFIGSCGQKTQQKNADASAKVNPVPKQLIVVHFQ